MKIILSLIVILGISSVFWDIYIHNKYRRLMRKYAPEEYEKVKGFNPFYNRGLPWTEYVLMEKYKSLNIPELTEAGDTLYKTYHLFGKFGGIGFSLTVLGALAFAIWFVFKSVT